MPTLSEAMLVYRRAMREGTIQTAYRGLMAFMGDLRTHFHNRCPDWSVAGSLYAGFMDMTYFSIVPPGLKARRLKIAVVFLHEPFRFEVWLSGANRDVQEEYWRIFRERGAEPYRLVDSPRKEDAVLVHVLDDDPDFAAPAALTEHLERDVLVFVRDVERFLFSA